MQNKLFTIIVMLAAVLLGATAWAAAPAATAIPAAKAVGHIAMPAPATATPASARPEIASVPPSCCPLGPHPVADSSQSSPTNFGIDISFLSRCS